MKKLLLGIVFSVCAVEIGLAVYHVPIANFSLLVVVTVAGLGGLAALKLLARCSGTEPTSAKPG